MLYKVILHMCDIVPNHWKLASAVQSPDVHVGPIFITVHIVV